MDKTVAGLLGAMGALVMATPGQAAVQPLAPETVLSATSYSDLLRPIPNAAATLRAVDEQGMQPSEGGIELVQLGPVVRALVDPHHHHHHHHRYRRPPPRRHHHHHHHHNHY